MAVKFTNKHNLPKAFFNALITDEHIMAGDISVTTLIDAPQIRMLKKTHDYEIDVMDLVGMAIGSGIHSFLERASKGTFNSRALQRAVGILLELGEDKGAGYLKKIIKEKLEEQIDDDLIVEQTLTIEIEGWTISGTFDRYTKSLKLLEDYKSTSAAQVMNVDQKKSWTAQANIYAVMLRDNDLEVNQSRIIAIIKDWSKMKTNTSRDYPKTPVVMIDLKLIDDEDVRKYMASRVKLHQRAESGESIPCTPKDRWATPDVFAVMKKGGKRSLSNNLSREMAQAWIEKNQAKLTGEVYIEHRKGQSFRCANGYCPVSHVCPQYKAELEAAAAESQEM